MLRPLFLSVDLGFFFLGPHHITWETKGYQVVRSPVVAAPDLHDA
jgi:hypothetical protein